MVGKKGESQAVSLHARSNTDSGAGVPGGIYQDIQPGNNAEEMTLRFQAGNNPYITCTRGSYEGDQIVTVRVSTLQGNSEKEIGKKTISLGYSTERVPNETGGLFDWLKPNWRQESLSFSPPAGAGTLRVAFESGSEITKACGAIITDVELQQKASGR